MNAFVHLDLIEKAPDLLVSIRIISVLGEIDLLFAGWCA
jgi:hypothetical protein